MRIRQALRASLTGVVALALCVAAGVATRLPAAGAAQREALASRFSFQDSPLAPAPANARTVRQVEPALRPIRNWISAVGASVALSDLDGDGLANDRCLVDPRDDSVSVGPTPDHAGRYAAFDLVPTGLRYDVRTTAPMGCLTADLNEDGNTDVLVYFWGRAPVAYLHRPGAKMTPGAFRAVDIAPDPGEIWNSTTANVLDIDGDGHLDVFVGNYFPDGARVLDPGAAGDPRIQMQDSMSNAHNGGRNRILRLDTLVTDGGLRLPRYGDASAALTDAEARSWTLAIGAQDLNGDGLPELYVANDFGPDYLLVNRSRPGRIRLDELRGTRDAGQPKSKVLGYDSFKGMGVTFTDLNGDTRPDIVVSNIATAFALQESNFAFVSTGTGPLGDGRAPYRDDSFRLGLGQSGWAWDVKAADFDGDGHDEIVQAVGFLAGRTDRWAQLQELAMGNDELLRHPGAWPHFGPGDDIAGHQRDPFYVRDASGRFVDIAADLGLDNPGPSRAIAIADVDHDGRPDMAIANQWAQSQFLRNSGPQRAYLGLRLMLAANGPGTLPRPAIGAQVTAVAADGRTRSGQLFPTNGHTGVNAAELLFGFGARPTGPLAVTVSWRDLAGQHRLHTTLDAGWHTVVLDAGHITR